MRRGEVRLPRCALSAVKRACAECAQRFGYPDVHRAPGRNLARYVCFTQRPYAREHEGGSELETQKGEVTAGENSQYINGATH